MGMRTTISILLPWILASVTAGAATITGTAIPSAGTNLVTTVEVKPLSTPLIIGTNLIYSVNRLLRTDTNGAWSIDLIQGDYQVTVAGRDVFRIVVPNSTNSLNFLDLLNTNQLSYIYRVPGGLVRISTNDTAFGFLIDKLQAGSSIVFTKLNGGSNELLSVALDPSISAAIAAKVAIAGDTMTGPLITTTITSSSQRDAIGTLSPAGTNTLDFATNTINTLSPTGDCVFVSSGLAPGFKIRLFLFAPTNDIALNFPATWRWVGLLPTNMLANTAAIVDGTSLGTNDPNVVAEYREE